MVRAAKSTGRLTRKSSSIVITNETLLKTGGHVGMASQELQSEPLPKPLGGMTRTVVQRAPQQQQPTYSKPRNDEIAKRRAARQAAAADYTGDSVEQGQNDPAMQEHQLQQTTTQTPVKPPID